MRARLITDRHQFNAGLEWFFKWVDVPAGAVSVLAGSAAAAAVAGVVSAGLGASAGLSPGLDASAGLDSAFFSSFFLKTARNLAFKLLSAFGAVNGGSG